MADFETTVFDGQTYTEVWASACVELFTDNVKVYHNIYDLYDYFVNLNDNVIAYFHNLKFDGAFWLSYLLTDLKYEQAYKQLSDSPTDIDWLKDKYMKNKTFKYSISDKGMWYTIIIKVNNHFIEIRDSLKLLPFSVKTIGKSFKTAHQKLDIEYIGFRYANCTITKEEEEYIKNDVLVVKEALEIMFKQGHNKLTIGSCCLEEFKATYDKIDYENLFPNLYEVELDQTVHGSVTVGDWIRKSYRGGWCYLVKGKEDRIFKNGSTADVNSLYPSMMSSESGNKYPIGKPTFWHGNFIPDKALDDNKFFFIRIKTRFYIKENMLPFIQIKTTPLYKCNEALETSDIYDKRTNGYYNYYYDSDNNLHDTRVELTLTQTDYYLILEHYELVDFEILDGCYFYAQVGLFDTYINKYKELKLNSKGALRELAKLFLNNLYGKMASNTDSSFKLAYVKEDNSIGFIPIKQAAKEPGYIPIGSAITSYARNFTIRSAQKNYHGVNERGFIYADTDSIHCDLEPHEITGITVHDKNFCCWKIESQWDKAIFARQKTYIEHVTHEDCNPIDEPYYNIKCAGMPQKCKNLLNISLQGYEPKEDDSYSEEDLEFIKTKRELTDFKVGLKIHGKLMPKRIQGGIILVETTYEMR